MRGLPSGSRCHAGTNAIKEKPLQVERAPGEASQNPHTHQSDCQVQATVWTTDMKVVYIRGTYLKNNDQPESRAMGCRVARGRAKGLDRHPRPHFQLKIQSPAIRDHL